MNTINKEGDETMTKKSSQEQREQLQKKELKNNPMGIFSDQLNQAQSGMPNTTGMSLKEVGALIVLGIVGLIGYGVYKMFS